YCGGNPLWAHPQGRFVAPSFALILLFGTPLGLKLQVTLALGVGLLGAWRLARRLGLEGGAALVPPAVFMLGGTYAFHLVGGQTHFLSMGLMPWVLAPLFGPAPTVRRGVAAACALALLLLEGGIYTLVQAALLLGCCGAVLAAA